MLASPDPSETRQVLYFAALLMAAPGVDVRDAAARILADPRYQTRLPSEPAASDGRGEPGGGGAPRGGRPSSAEGAARGADSPASGSDEGEPQASAPAEARPEAVPRRFSLPSTLSGAARGALWALLIVVVIVAAVYVGRNGWSRSGAAAPDPERRPRTERRRPAGGSSGVADWRALARRKRYGDAVHALLLDALGRIPASGGGSLASSLTSREILSRARLPGDAREALARLVDAVELSRFGGQPADESLFESCREAHSRLGGSS